jgi:hypothetical protein
VSKESNYRVQQWKPPARPEWVRRVNEEGQCLDLKSVVPLDENSLLSHAKANTGLSDFGVDDWVEPFQVFVKSLDKEANLHLMGRLMTRSDILMHLEARLRIEDTYKKHPEIDDVQLSPTVLIVGSGRSGTSAIQNFLALDPDNRTTKTWEVFFPCPPPEAATYESDPRIALADGRMDMWNRVTPEIAAVHEFRGHMPTELIQLECVAFQNSGWLDLYGLCPTYDQYVAPRGFVNSFKYAKRVLKLLQWKSPRKRWILKSPDAMRHFPDVFKVFPDWQIAWMHRDPLKAVASAVNMIGTLFWIRSDQPLSPLAIAQLTSADGLANQFNKVIDEIESGQIPVKQMHHVQYLDFVNDAVGTIEKLYRNVGAEFTPAARAAMETYLRENPREARPAHKYSGGDEAKRAAERKLFERYDRISGCKYEL